MSRKNINDINKSPLMIELGCKIKELRKKRGLNQKVFAKSLGITQGQISNIESGISFPSTDILITMRLLFPDLDMNWLLPGEIKTTPVVSGQDIESRIKRLEDTVYRCIKGDGEDKKPTKTKRGSAGG